MAKATFTIQIDMRTFAGYDFSEVFGSGGSGQTSDTEYSWRYNSGFYEDVTGSGFSAGFGTTFPNAGTVNGWDFGINELLPNPNDPWHPISSGYSYWTFTGLSVPAADFSNAVDGTGADVAAYMPTMLAGSDTVNGSAYDDYLMGYDGADRIYGNDGNDILLGGDGGDKLYGNAGSDSLDGGAGGDLLDGGTGKDTMLGGLGNDTYYVDSSGDKTIEDASAGTDTVISSVSFALSANVEKLALGGTAAINGTGNSLANTITGNSAANTLKGGGGDDILKGGGGDDILYGGAGNDTLYGDAGGDTFVFDTALNAATNADKISGFTVGEDTIALDDDIFTAAGVDGRLAADAFFAGAAAHDASDRIIYNSATGNIYYDPDGDGAAAQVFFAHVTAGTALTNGDFLIVA